MRLISLAWASRDDRGSALAAVVGIVLLTVVVALTVATTTVQSLERTDDTRDTVSAEFAAEAGVTVAQSAIAEGTCGSGTFQPSNLDAPPLYRAVVILNPAGPSNETVGCPTAGVPYSIVSTGYDSRGAFDAEDGRSVEARYDAVPEPAAPTGPPVYAFGSLSFSQGTEIVTTSEGITVVLNTGDFTCTQSSAGGAAVVVKSGSATVGNTCDIKGLWAPADIPAGYDPATDDDGLPPGTVVAGENRATVNGPIVARDLRLGNNQQAEFGPLFADVTTESDPGELVAEGPVGTRSEGLTAHPMPGVPGWVDYDFDPADWPGFEVKPLSPTACSGASARTEIANLIAGFSGAPGVIDATLCDSLGLDNASLTLPNDLVILARSFIIKRTTITGGGAEKLWLITEDEVSNNLPTCGASGTGITTGPTEVGANITFTGVETLFYTPCDLVFTNPIEVTGQLYARNISATTQLTLTPTQIGLPGEDLSGGTATPPVEIVLTSYRNTSVTAAACTAAPAGCLGAP